MKIKKNRQLKPGDLLFLKIKKSYGETECAETYPIKVIKSYPHHVLCTVFHSNDWTEVRSFSNVDFLMLGVYKASDIDGNLYNVELDPSARESTDNYKRNYKKKSA